MKRPLLLAHRGFSGNYPENSPLAFRMAVEKTAADGFESDVHITKDGKLVIFHDASVERTSNGTGFLSPSGTLKTGGKTVELLLDQTFAFTLADVRKNILVPFRVDRDFDHLAICLHYGPKAIRDPEIIMPQIRKCVKTYFPAGYQLTEADMQEYQELFNFVTLSLDKNGEYVGCAHRHPPQQILTISASGSSWGFAPTAASAGDWRAVLHVQAVVVGTVDYHLKIYGMERGEQDAEIPSL